MTASPTRADTVVLSLGATTADGGTTFRVWAPDRRQVQLVLCRPPADADPTSGPAGDEAVAVHDLTREGEYWVGRIEGVRSGTLYKFRLDDDRYQTFPDPASRYQPFGVHGPSEVVDPSGFRWTDTRWRVPPLDALVVYELHVGTFSPAGTFQGVVDRLPRLVDLGVTAIELMPVADFAGSRNWGYDGVALFAPARCYGRPDDLRRLVDAAHARGLAVFLDVVYNHFGPDGAYANSFSSHYFTDAHESPWGRGVNLDGPHSSEVRRFFVENALHWITEYHFDGLRLDATHALVDDSGRHFLSDLTSTVRARSDGRTLYFVAEDHRNLSRLLKPVESDGFGVDAVWADDFHHQARVHTARDREGYYADFSGSADDLAKTIELGWFYTGQPSAHLGHARGTDPSALAPRQFVVCIQNHDQVGNRADGARLNHQIDLAAFRALSTLLLLAPQTPMLFMGQEWAATSPFLFFTDHDAELGRKITEGRRAEFAAFAAFADPAEREHIPDPQAAATFERSRLKWDEAGTPPHRGVWRLHQRLLAMRRTGDVLRERPRGSYTVRAVDEHTVLLDYRSGTMMVIVRLSGGPADLQIEAGDSATILLTTEDADVCAEPQPVGVERNADTLSLRFTRPGAVVLSRCTGPRAER